MSSSSTEQTAAMDFVDYMESMEIPFEEIASATNNFAQKNLILRGSYANVYKGQLVESGTVTDIVVRKYRKPNGKVVTNDLMMYKNLKHKNIVPLFKIDDMRDQGLTILKYEAHESLDKHLRGSTLSWMQRLQICVGVGNALCYLHFGLQDDHSVLHGNIKSSKILLDDNWEPKLHDFRCAVEVRRNKLYTTSQYTGTLQYMDPEFKSTGGLTHKSDVFSFGVVLFEVLFGTKASIPYNPVSSNFVVALCEALSRRKTSISEDIWYFAKLARLHYEENKLDDMIDPNLRKQMDNQSLKIFSETAYCCLKEHREDRPDMVMIVKKLERALRLQQIQQSRELPGASASRFKGGNMDDLKVPLSEILSATKDFSNLYYIGSGGFGEVYKAKLDRFGNKNLSDTKGKNDGELPNVAIKRIPSIRTGGEGFNVEIELLSKCKHPNVISLLGFCHQGHDMMLIYEYASKGSLDDYLINNSSMTSLTWVQRLQICLGIAQGLDYLHASTPDKPTIIHRDVKSANILLDDKLVAKIADFGLSKFHHENPDKTLIESSVAGTEVYIDPEYKATGKLKKQSDIYSFGVVLFEILHGKLAYDNAFKDGLASVARQCYKDGTLKKLVDPNIKKVDENIFRLDGGVNEDSLEIFLEIASKCVLELQSERPTMNIVIQELKKALSLQEKNKDRFHISLKDIQLATENFSDHNCIGEGRHWKQYDGEITHANKRTIVVAKRWDSNFPQSQQQFFTEVQILKNFKQENMISLMGYCNEMEEKIIVYEKPSNGRLSEHLDDPSLTWMRRLKICIDVAKGIEFLHSSISIKHRDIKSASILLDDNWKAKISNLELSTVLSEINLIEHITDDNAYGSLCYVSKDDKESGYLTRESDIYSLGVVLKEVLLRRLTIPTDRVINHYVPNGQEDLFTQAFEGIEEQTDRTSLYTFTNIASLCLAYREYRPGATEVVKQLEKALKFQEDYEEWKPRLPKDYKNIIQMSEDPDLYQSIETRKDLYNKFLEGILLQDGERWFSIDRNGRRNEMISATNFSYKNRRTHKWRSVRSSRFSNLAEIPSMHRFSNVAEITDISNLKIQINIEKQLISSSANHKVQLIFRVCGLPRKPQVKRMYVNLKYKSGKETLHSYFATWREDGWMMIELFQSFTHKEETGFQVLLESFSRSYCGSSSIYIEGIEFQAIDNVNNEETKGFKEVQKVKLNTDKGKKDHIHEKKQDMMISAKKIVSTSSKLMTRERFDERISQPHQVYHDSNTFSGAIEFLRHQVFRIRCKIQRQMLSTNTKNVCYLVFKLSDKCRELHGPVKVFDIFHRKETRILYFRSPSPINIHDSDGIPEKREDGWMEVILWIFDLGQELKDYLFVNLKLITYEGTLSGLILRGMEFRAI